MSEQIGFTKVNYAKKAFGIVSTNAVSLTTGLLLGMRLFGRGESFGNVVMLLMQQPTVQLPKNVNGTNLDLLTPWIQWTKSDAVSSFLEHTKE